MRLFLPCVIAACLAFPVHSLAADPGFYKVTGVVAGDVLNIRPEPGPGGEPLAGLQPGASPVEVLEVRDVNGAQWGRVLAGDGNGWVSMKFLAPAEIPMFEGTEIPDGLSCGGTEPFWGASFTNSAGLRFSDIDGKDTALPVSRAMNATGRMHRFAVKADDGKTFATAMLGRYESCTDGMIDRDFGWRIDLLMEKEGDPDFPQLF
ncbi:MAG TPA: SH3 domain-containing protein, partial [Rhizobiaceae bacterium]|nr:SH3 domain-containing protein [Rhizobiaceae bacterium]